MTVRHAIVLGLLALLGTAFWTLASGYVPDTELNRSALYYAQNTASETGAQNVVAAIIVTYRGLDTLGEVTVLFLTSAIIGLVLAVTHSPGRSAGSGLSPAGELLVTGTRMLVPVIALFGAYVFINGHLTPGGGFQGGAVLATGALLLLMADPGRRFSHQVIARIESVSGVAYVVLGVLGLALAGGFLDSRLLPLGTLGGQLSAGTIPLVYTLIGLKVGAEFSSILTHFKETEDPA